jgi:hypothetical protein
MCVSVTSYEIPGRARRSVDGYRTPAPAAFPYGIFAILSASPGEQRGPRMRP